MVADDRNGRVRRSIVPSAPERYLGEHGRQILAAWERFVAGDDDLRGVPASVALSWHRCRDVYRVDPLLVGAPRASGRRCLSRTYHTVFAQLGGIAATIVAESADCLATITDGDGHIVASWGAGPSMREAAASSFAPFSVWSEPAVGTNGIGTALKERGPVAVRGPEHWCAALHGWDCLGIAVQDAVTGDPVAALNVSSWTREVPMTPSALAAETEFVRHGLRERALRDADDVARAYVEADRRSRGGLVGVDRAGSIVAANRPARDLLGGVAQRMIRSPDDRWRPGGQVLREITRNAMQSALDEPAWLGSVDLGILLGDRSLMFDITPVCGSDGIIGLLLASSERPSGELVSSAREPAARGRVDPTTRVSAVRDGRVLLLSPAEIRYAEAARHDVWLVTDRGRVRAGTHGIERVEAELAPLGFLRVHRSYVVNLGRVQEISHRRRGVLTLSTHPRRHEEIPVSRRCAADLRQRLGL